MEQVEDIIVTGAEAGEIGFDWLLKRVARPRPVPLRIAVVHPVSASSLQGAVDAASAGIAAPLYVGPRAKILNAAEQIGASLDSFEIVDVPHSHAAAAKAVEMVRSGHASALMKGALHTNELMAEIVKRDDGLRTERRMSHVFLIATSGYPKPLLISDGAINITPDLMTKKWITQNAIDAARAIGIDPPKVAVLSATEEVDPTIPNTIEAAALCKMADRGQIRGGVLDGPLAFDLAVSQEAVAAKGLTSPIAGDADVLIVPTLEAGNMLAKQLDYLAGASAAGIVMGASAPVILTSRADGPAERVASCAFAAAVAQWQEAQE
ncbi:bifunctional enoyl-CoA hydratase/phosphate acetyltransferase [Erythrobacter sp.]|uniref:bifunctional enoyl-CoA hydratase/phosphate acetyltransferase n=1 Tax=Erythrobacter sp. TaxID=1042 RepID=UPI0025C2DDCB|nr:bifunctional enoyl-CoA hydratase/phosphate acetyltransferase [Erythrobacter sp.]